MSRKVIYTLVLSILFLFLMTISVNASSTSISVSPSQTVERGTSVTVTARVTSGAWSLTLSGNGQSKGLVGQTNTTDNASASTSITFTANSDTYFTLEGDETDYYTDNTVPVSKSIKITVTEPKASTSDPDPAVVDTKPATNPGRTTSQKAEPVKTKVEEKKSSEAALKELTIEQEGLMPEFSTDVTEYKITVPNEITALNITAMPLDSKATVSIEGNENFVVGENKVTIKAVAEDGTTKEYVITVTRKRTNLALASLKITYIDKDGNVQELELNPKFDGAILEYNLADISYLIKALDIEAIANLEDAIIEISGNEDLHDGENIITIKLTIKAEPAEEGEEQEEDEVIIYTIKVNKEKEPTFWEKVKDKLKGIFGGVSTWFDNNANQIVFVALTVCQLALIGLAAYIMMDNNKYKDVIKKVKKVEELNNLETVEDFGVQDSSSVSNEEDIEESNIQEIQNEEKEAKKSGKHF